MHINVGCMDTMAYSIFTISGSRSALPPVALLCSLMARDISPGTRSIPITTYFNKEPSALVADCSFRAAKSKQKQLTATPRLPA